MNPLFLTKLVENRKHALILIVFVLIYILCSILEIDVWKCPIKTTLHIPCPGCGLTHAIFHLFQGHWEVAFREHALAPVFIVGFFSVFIITIMPSGLHNKLKNRMNAFETRTWISPVFFILLFFYWIIKNFIV